MCFLFEFLYVQSILSPFICFSQDMFYMPTPVIPFFCNFMYPYKVNFMSKPPKMLIHEWLIPTVMKLMVLMGEQEEYVFCFFVLAIFVSYFF